MSGDGEHDVAALRQGVLAVCVLDDVDVEPRDDGVVLPGEPPVFLPWAELGAACSGCAPVSPAGRVRLAALLRLRRSVADLGPGAGAALRARAVALALPRPVDGEAHALHPGAPWVLGSVPGGVLELGVGVDLSGDRSGPVVPLPASVARAAGVDPVTWWPELTAHAGAMGALVASRPARDPGRADTLRPVGGCDVLTLLASAPLRAALAGRDGSGLRAVAVPTRNRGWTDVTRVDPAYVATAWELTPPAERGCARTLLVTRDEVALPAPGGDVTRHAVER